MDEDRDAEQAGEPRPVTVGSLARALLEADDGQQLEVAVPAGVQLDVTGVAGAVVQGATLRFTSLPDRNRAVVAHVLDELGAQRTDPEALWSAARRLWRFEIGHPDMASGRLLAAVHPQVDVLRLAAARITSAHNAFDALHLVQAALPYLDAVDWPALIALCETEQPFTRGDLAGGMFYGKLTHWLAARPALARELVELLLGELTDARDNLLGAAWMGWFGAEPAQAGERLLQSAQRPEPLLRTSTCWTARRMLAEPSVPPALASRLDELILQRIASPQPAERRVGVAAAAALLHLRRAFDAALRARIGQADAEGTEAAAQVVQALAREHEALLQAGFFFDWLALCVGVGEGFERVLGELDYTLSALLRPPSPHIDPVFAFLEAWVRAHSARKAHKRDFAEQFDHCTRAIVADPALLARMATQWFASDGQALARAAAGVLADPAAREQTDLGFEPTLLDAASEADLRFLARRMLGFLIDADQMLSLALSLLRIRDAGVRVHPLLRRLLYEEIGYDYPATTAARLRAEAGQAQDAGAQALLEGIAAQLEADVGALEALPRLRELAAPQALRRGLRKARAKEMERTMREGEKKSVFAQLVTQVHVKAGESTFQYLQSDFSQPMPFASHSVSIELPRREALDPVGNAYRLMKLRTATRGSA